MLLQLALSASLLYNGHPSVSDATCARIVLVGGLECFLLAAIVAFLCYRMGYVRGRRLS